MQMRYENTTEFLSSNNFTSSVDFNNDIAGCYMVVRGTVLAFGAYQADFLG